MKLLKNIFKLAIIITFIYLVFFTSRIHDIKEILKENGSVKEYILNVSPNSDGTLDMTYNLRLDIDKKTECVKIKIPNKNFDVVFKGENIALIDKSLFGDYALIKLKRTYTEGENINLSFDLKQNNLYTLKDDKKILMYRIKPGRVNNFKCSNYTLNWKKSQVYFSGMGVENGEYITLNSKFNKFSTKTLMIQYKTESFENLNYENRKSNILYYFDEGYMYIIIAALVIISEIILYKRRFYESIGIEY